VGVWTVAVLEAWAYGEAELMGEGDRALPGIASRDDVLHPWADARRWLLVVPVALLPFLIAPIALMIVRTLLSVLGVPMVDIAYFLAAGVSAYLSVIWSTAIAPRRRWHVGRALSVTYWVISFAALVLLLVLDQHPFRVADESEVLEILTMGGFGIGALGAFAWVMGALREEA
jgi:hypothetical protein